MTSPILRILRGAPCATLCTLIDPECDLTCGYQDPQDAQDCSKTPGFGPDLASAVLPRGEPCILLSGGA
jgi:hypothetical protein